MKGWEGAAVVVVVAYGLAVLVGKEAYACMVQMVVVVHVCAVVMVAGMVVLQVVV